jgi:hypothetical protein
VGKLILALFIEWWWRYSRSREVQIQGREMRHRFIGRNWPRVSRRSSSSAINNVGPFLHQRRLNRRHTRQGLCGNRLRPPSRPTSPHPFHRFPQNLPHGRKSLPWALRASHRRTDFVEPPPLRLLLALFVFDCLWLTV